MKLNFNLDKPIYLQIIDEFKRKIAREELSPGDKIPSQRDLARDIKVNPNTVQSAYREMERIGLVETLRGQGTFIMENHDLIKNIKYEMAREAIKNFLKEMYSLGYEYEEIKELFENEKSIHDEGGYNV